MASFDNRPVERNFQARRDEDWAARGDTRPCRVVRVDRRAFDQGSVIFSSGRRAPTKSGARRPLVMVGAWPHA